MVQVLLAHSVRARKGARAPATAAHAATSMYMMHHALQAAPGGRRQRWEHDPHVVLYCDVKQGNHRAIMLVPAALVPAPGLHNRQYMPN